jgi:hypothetical protein
MKNDTDGLPRLRIHNPNKRKNQFHRYAINKSVQHAAIRGGASICGDQYGIDCERFLHQTESSMAKNGLFPAKLTTALEKLYFS